MAGAGLSIAGGVQHGKAGKNEGRLFSPHDPQRQDDRDPGAQRLIIILDGYKTNSPDKGAQYVGDYKAIRSWVVPRYRKEQSELQPGRPASPGAPYSPNTFNDKLADLALEEKL